MTRAEIDAWCKILFDVGVGFVVAAILMGLFVFFAWSKEGDDHGNHGALKSWFDQLRSKRGMCCSFADGRTVEDVDWDTQGGHYRVRLDGEWIPVPDEAVIDEPNRFGQAVVWPYRNEYDEEGVSTHGWHIRCFMPGAGT